VLSPHARCFGARFGYRGRGALLLLLAENFRVDLFWVHSFSCWVLEAVNLHASGSRLWEMPLQTGP
jgi:hypothetical protein